MTTKAAAKKKPAKKTKPVDDIDAKPASFPDQLEIENDPNLVRKIPKLEVKAKEIANRRDRIKRLKEEEEGLTAEAIIIMHDHEIKAYDRDDVHLRIDEKETLKVSVD